MVIRVALEALHLYRAFLCSVYYCFTHLACMFVSKSTTTNAGESVPPRGKARDVLLFLDSGTCRLLVTLTRTAIQALHYRTFVLFSMDVRSPSRHNFSLATGQLTNATDSIPL